MAVERVKWNGDSKVKLWTAWGGVSWRQTLFWLLSTNRSVRAIHSPLAWVLCVYKWDYFIRVLFILKLLICCCVSPTEL